MSIAVQTLAKEKITSLTLAQCIFPNQGSNQTHGLCLFENDTLIVSQHFHCIDIAEKSFINALPECENHELELVVFSEISITALLDILQVCQLTLQYITAINNRNEQVSYRFGVSCPALTAAKQNLAHFTLANNIDAALLFQAPTLSSPGILVMDMDSTTIEIECIDEIAKLAGVGDEVSAVTELAMQGQLDFAQSLHQRVATLTNAPVKILAEVAENMPLMKGLIPLINELKKHHWRIAIASGGFTYFAEHLKSLLELDQVYANQLEIVGGKLTGKVLGDVVDAQAKADSLATLTALYHIDHKQTVAMGDGANDLVMMAAAYLGVAFEAKPIVLEQADTCINHSGLDCLLHWLK